MTILGILRLKLRVDTNFKAQIKSRQQEIGLNQVSIRLSAQIHDVNPNFKAQIKSRHLQNASKLRLDGNFKAQNPKKCSFERSNLIFQQFEASKRKGE